MSSPDEKMWKLPLYVVIRSIFTDWWLWQKEE